MSKQSNSDGTTLSIYGHKGGGTNFNDLDGFLWKAGSTTTNVTTENFIGFSDAAYSNSATATVKVVGNTTTQSSLTPGQKYYVQPNGTLALTEGDPSVEAGIALSATTLLIKG